MTTPGEAPHPTNRVRRRGALTRTARTSLALGVAGASSAWPVRLARAGLLAGGGDEGRPAAAGTYRLHSEKGERVLELRLDPGGAAALSEPVLPRAGRQPYATSGGWSVVDGAPDTVRVSLVRQGGRALAQPEVFTVTFAGGFPMLIRSERRGGTAGPADALEVERLGFTLGSGDTHPLVRVLHSYLSVLARQGIVPFLTTPPPTAVYDEATRQAVAAFQASQRLVPTGAVDATTWRALLSAASVRWVVLPPLTSLPTPTPAGAAAAQNQNVVYLTFDDGPNPPYTDQMLEILARYGALATFFTVGQQVQAFPALVRAEAMAGHYVANHTFDHHTLDGASQQLFFAEAQLTRHLILDTAGDLFTLDHDVLYLRPPYGATDANTQAYAATLGYTVVLWDVDPQDWRQPDAAQVANHVLSHIYPGAVVLMHDGGGPRDQSVAALDIILRELTARGYVSQTIFSKYVEQAPTPAPSPDPAPGPSLVVANTGGLGVNVHSEPGLSTPVLIAVPEGTVLADLGGRQQADGLLWVQVRTPQGVVGWVAAQYVLPV